MKFNDIQHWMREVIWYGHRSGKYLCNIEKIENFKKKTEQNSKYISCILNTSDAADE